MIIDLGDGVVRQSIGYSSGRVPWFEAPRLGIEHGKTFSDVLGAFHVSETPQFG
jgi:hypothetical protein